MKNMAKGKKKTTTNENDCKGVKKIKEGRDKETNQKILEAEQKIASELGQCINSDVYNEMIKTKGLCQKHGSNPEMKDMIKTLQKELQKNEQQQQSELIETGFYLLHNRLAAFSSAQIIYKMIMNMPSEQELEGQLNNCKAGKKMKTNEKVERRGSM